MTPNRIVVLLTPVFVGLSGWVVELIARYFPGHPHLNGGLLTDMFIAGATLAGAAIVAWLHGWQKHEARLPVANTTTVPPK